MSGRDDRGVWRLRGVLLPAGETAELWVADGVLVPGPVDGATTLCDGGWIMPGLVDAHCHVGLGRGGAVSMDTAREQALADRDGGALLLRDAGSPTDTRAFDDDPELPRIIRAGRHIARPRRYIAGYAAEIEPGELVTEVERQARAGDGWVKIVGDWIDRSAGADSDLMPLWDPAVLSDAVCAVHEAGARIAVHAFSHRVIDSLIEAGVDDIEHGSGIDVDQAAEIAARGIAVTPTLRQVELFQDFAAQAGQKYPVYAATMRGMYETRREHFEMLVDAGVLLLMGTDSGGYQDHGTIAGELALWLQWGAPAQFTIDAATWVSQRYLGYPGLVEGGPADFLFLNEDPRIDPLALSRPARVMLGGSTVWERTSA